MKLRKYIIIFMVMLALIQRSNKIEFLIFELVIYLVISLYIRKSSKSNKTVSDKNSYKYENINNIEVSDHKLIEKIDWDEVNSDIQEARESIEAKKERIKSYDYREFIGRKNVDWNEVYDYLWKQYRYKGIMMWQEYMDELVKNGVIKKEEMKLVFKKAGNYIPWKPRPDLEAIYEYEKDAERNEDKKRNAFFDEVNNYAESLYKKGIWDKEQYDKFYKSNEASESYLKTFDYEEYLKRKGFV